MAYSTGTVNIEINHEIDIYCEMEGAFRAHQTPSQYGGMGRTGMNSGMQTYGAKSQREVHMQERNMVDTGAQDVIQERWHGHHHIRKCRCREHSSSNSIDIEKFGNTFSAAQKRSAPDIV